MKKTTAVFSLLLSVLMLGAGAQVMTVCTPEQLEAARNQRLAASIQVVNTATQQTQCYYSQLATYWQQKDKDNQQIAKDAQQVAKDAQQIAKDKELLARELVCNTPAPCVPEVDPNPWVSDGCGGWKRTVRCEVWTCDAAGNMCIDSIPFNDWLKIKGECAYFAEQDYDDSKKDYKSNRSGGGDGTNPGGHGNVRGLKNPHNTH